MLCKDFIVQVTGITLDNASIALFAACLAILIFNKNIKEVFQHIVDWEIGSFYGSFYSNWFIGTNGSRTSAGRFITEVV